MLDPFEITDYAIEYSTVILNKCNSISDIEYYISDINTNLAKYETIVFNYISTNNDCNVTDLKQSLPDVIDEILAELELNIIKYEDAEDNKVYQVYNSVCELLKSTKFPDVSNVHIENQPADPDVGIYDSESTITFTLNNGREFSLIFENN